MSRSITIPEVPDHVVSELAARAARTGRSLQGYARDQLNTLAATPDPESWLTRVRERKAATAVTLPGPAILIDRYADRP